MSHHPSLLVLLDKHAQPALGEQDHQGGLTRTGPEVPFSLGQAYGADVTGGPRVAKGPLMMLILLNVQSLRDTPGVSRSNCSLR